MAKPKWRPGSFLDNFNAAALHLGHSDLPLAWHLAKVRWGSTKERDVFLKALTNVQQGANDLTAPRPEGRPQ